MYREVGNIISDHVEQLGYSVVRTYTGHGIGRMFHQAP
jgi:methionyl aminopeptidase